MGQAEKRGVVSTISPTANPGALRPAWLQAPTSWGRRIPAAHPQLRTWRPSSRRKASWLAQEAVKPSTSRTNFCNSSPSCSCCCLCSQVAFNSWLLWPRSLRALATSRKSGEPEAAMGWPFVSSCCSLSRTTGRGSNPVCSLGQTSSRLASTVHSSGSSEVRVTGRGLRWVSPRDSLILWESYALGHW